MARRYAWRPLGEARTVIYAWLANNPGSGKKHIVEATGLRPETVRNVLYKSCLDGEIVTNDGANNRNYKYSIGTLVDRTPKEKNWKRPKKPKPEKVVKPKKSKVVKKAKPKSPVIKQTKPAPVFEKKQVNIVYPAGFKVTVCPSVPYEPLKPQHLAGRYV